MAKKPSARSKGYRTYQKKKETHQWTEQEKRLAKRAAIAAAAVILVVVVIVLVARNAGVLQVKDGAVQNTQESWVLCNAGTSSKPRVYRIAETEPIEGFTLKDAERVVVQGLYNTYESSDESAFPASYTLGAAKNDYDVACETVVERLSGDTSEIVKGETAGKKTAYFIHSYSVGDPVEDGGEGVEYYQYFYGYTDVKLKGHSMFTMIGGKASDEASYLTEDELAAMFEKIMANTSIG